MGGYGCGVSFRSLLVNVIADSCTVSEDKAGHLVDQICRVAAEYGLLVDGYGNVGDLSIKQNHALGGQMLQIFIARKHVEKFVYRSLAYGYEQSSKTTLSEWLYPTCEVSD